MIQAKKIVLQYVVPTKISLAVPSANSSLGICCRLSLKNRKAFPITPTANYRKKLWRLIMQKITDLTQLWLLPLQKGFLRIIFMLPDYEKYLSQGLLYYTQTETGVLLFHRRHTHWQLYYF